MAETTDKREMSLYDKMFFFHDMKEDPQRSDIIYENVNSKHLLFVEGCRRFFQAIRCHFVISETRVPSFCLRPSRKPVLNSLFLPLSNCRNHERQETARHSTSCAVVPLPPKWRIRQ